MYSHNQSVYPADVVNVTSLPFLRAALALCRFFRIAHRTLKPPKRVCIPRLQCPHPQNFTILRFIIITHLLEIQTHRDFSHHLCGDIFHPPFRHPTRRIFHPPSEYPTHQHLPQRGGVHLPL